MRLTQHSKTKRYSRQIWLHSSPSAHYTTVWGAEWAEMIKNNVELAWGGSLGNPGHSVDGACVQHCHVCWGGGEHCTHTQDTFFFLMMRSHWWTHSKCSNSCMSVVPCNKTAIAGRSHSPVQREVDQWQRRREEDREARARGGEPETRTGIEIRQIESYWKKRRGREVSRGRE